MEQLDALTQALFLKTFGDPLSNPNRWAMEALGNLSCKFSDGPFGSNLKSEHYVENGIRVIRLQNIGVGRFIDDDRAFISEEHFKKLKKHACQPGDVLIGTLGDPNLRACIQPEHIPIALNKADCVQMRCDLAKCTPEYVVALLNCPSTEKMAQNKIQGRTQLRISMGRLRELNVPVPPVNLQITFARVIKETESEKTKVNAHCTDLKSLFISLQHRAFRGDL